MHVGRKLGGRRADGAPRVEGAEQEPVAGAVGGDDEALQQQLRKLRDDLGRQRRAAEDADALDAGVDDLRVREPLLADRRADAVGADQHVAVGGAAVVEAQRDAIRALLVADGAPAGVERVAQARHQDLAQRAAVDRRVRPRPVVGRAEVRHRADLVQLVGEHDRLPALGRLARGLEVELVEVAGQARLQRVATVAVDVQQVARLAAQVRIALEHVDGVPFLQQPLGQAEAAQAAARDEHVQLLLHIRTVCSCANRMQPLTLPAMTTFIAEQTPVTTLPGEPVPYVIEAGSGRAHVLLGEVGRALVGAEESGGAMSVMSARRPARRRPIPLHYHDNEYEFFYCLRGAVQLWADDESRVL